MNPRVQWPTPAGFGSLSGESGESVYLIEKESVHVDARGRHSYRPVNMYLRYEWQSEGRNVYAMGESVPGQCITRSMIAVGKTPEDTDRIMDELLETRALTPIGTLSAGMHFRVNLTPEGARRLYDADRIIDTHILDNAPKEGPRTMPSRLWMVCPKRGSFSAPSATIDGKARFFPHCFPEDLTLGIDGADAISSGRLLDAGVLFPDGEYVLTPEALKHFADLAVHGREGRFEDELSTLIMTAYKGPSPAEAVIAYEAEKARKDLNEGFGFMTVKGRKSKEVTR